MTTRRKTMAEIRDAEAEKYAERILNTLEDEDARARSFKAGFDCRDKLDNEALKLAITALEIYGMTNETFPEYGDVAISTLAKIRKIMGDG